MPSYEGHQEFLAKSSDLMSVFRRHSQTNYFTCAYSSLSHFEGSETYHLKSIHKNFV